MHNHAGSDAMSAYAELEQFNGFLKSRKFMQHKQSSLRILIAPELASSRITYPAFHFSSFLFVGYITRNINSAPRNDAVFRGPFVINNNTNFTLTQNIVFYYSKHMSYHLT